MKANELRIGNYTQWANEQDEIVVSVDGIEIDPEDKEYLVSYTDLPTELENIIQLEFFEPIPLTKEWLEKFGFEETKRGWLSAPTGEDYKRWLVCFNDGGFSYIPELTSFKYVHQLQNLYYALTGEELTIKDHENPNPEH